MNILGRFIRSGLKSFGNGYKLGNPFINLNKNAVRYQSNTNSMKVTILGAAGNLGKSVSLMLKQSPYIDELCLYDSNSLEGFASDLNYIDTKCKVTSYFGPKDIQPALLNSNVVLIFAHCQHCDSFTYSSLFDKNAPIVKEHATNIAKFSPKSLITIAAEPINSLVPMLSEIMKRHGQYNPCNIFGITTIDVVRANKFVADILGLDPECVAVPMIGGHSDKTIVPVLSKAAPCSELTNEELEDVTKSIQEADRNLLKVRTDGGYLSNAFATARFVISLVKAMRGQNEIVECAFVKCKHHAQLKYMVTPLVLGPGGIAKNLGIPDLTDYESCLFENAIPILMDEIKQGEFAGGRPMEMVDGKLQDKPICDPCDVNPKAPRCPPNHCEIQALFADKKSN